MKKSFAVFLSGSLMLNAALVSLFLVGSSTPNTATSPVAAIPTAAPEGGPVKVDADVWPNLGADDLPQLATRLRDAGFPPAIVRAIVAAQLQEAYNARRKALDPDSERRPFWKNQPFDLKLAAALRQLEREQQKAYRALLGDAADADDPMSRVFQDRRFAGVPPDRLPQVRQVMQSYDDLREDIFAANRGAMMPDDRARLAALEKEQHDAIAKLLSPAELAKFDLLSSNSANSLRSTLSAFNPTEQEFLALYPLQRAFDESVGRYSGPPSPADMIKRNAAQQLLQDQIKTTLGPDRYADYERTTDSNYRQTSQLVARLELQPETANQVWTVQKDIQQRANALRGNNSLPGDERTTQLAALKDEAAGKITTLLGPRGFEAYKQNGGYWFQELTPPPAKKN